MRQDSNRAARSSCSCSLQGHWIRWSLKAPANPNYSIIDSMTRLERVNDEQWPNSNKELQRKPQPTLLNSALWTSERNYTGYFPTWAEEPYNGLKILQIFFCWTVLTVLDFLKDDLGGCWTGSWTGWPVKFPPRTVFLCSCGDHYQHPSGLKQSGSREKLHLWIITYSLVWLLSTDTVQWP